MAKHHHDFDRADAVRIDDDAVESECGSDHEAGAVDRDALLVKFLSHSEGFAAAGRSLGGSFASPPALKDVKPN